ncbi:hypothetical protein BDU57DRAFT_407890, partial [Ampelomyces quisqualis]
WSRHKGFFPDPKADFVNEFERLADHLGWNAAERQRYPPEYIEAEFDRYYGLVSKSLRNWHNLCRICLVEPLPHYIDDCVRVSCVLVNIVNLPNNRRTGKPAHVFATKRHFIDYTYPNRRYPAEGA